MTEATTRYSDDDLQEFKNLIDAKLAKANEQLRSLREQIMDLSENSGDSYGGDWIDDSSFNTDREMLHEMANRQRKYIQDLQNALIRIRNKTYGVCSITGELIDRKRLIAVPTTTKSLNAKNEEQKIAEAKSSGTLPKMPYIKKEGETPKVISKVIKRTSSTSPSKMKSSEEDDDDFFMEDDIDLNRLSSRLKNYDDEDDDIDDIADDSSFEEEDDDDDF